MIKYFETKSFEKAYKVIAFIERKDEDDMQVLISPDIECPFIATGYVFNKDESLQPCPPSTFLRVFNRTLERIKEHAFESEQRKKKFEFTIFGYTFKFSISYE